MMRSSARNPWIDKSIEVHKDYLDEYESAIESFTGYLDALSRKLKQCEDEIDAFRQAESEWRAEEEEKRKTQAAIDQAYAYTQGLIGNLAQGSQLNELKCASSPLSRSKPETLRVEVSYLDDQADTNYPTESYLMQIPDL